MVNQKKHKPVNFVIMFFVSILLLSISMVSSIGVFQNRSFYFDGYIYNNYIRSDLIRYCADVYGFVTEAMTKKRQSCLSRKITGFIITSRTITQKILLQIYRTERALLIFLLKAI